MEDQNYQPKEKMQTFIINAFYKKNVAIKSPGIAVDATKYSTAISTAKLQSRLSAFPEKWEFR